MKKSILFGAMIVVNTWSGVGVGYDAMLGGVSGLSVQVPLTSTLGVQMIGNGEYDKGTGWIYGAGLRFGYALASADNATLSIGLGGGFTGDPDNAMTRPFGEVPFGIDYKFADHFSVTGQTGLVYQGGDAAKFIAFNQGGANFLGSFAFHYWF